MLVKNRSMRPLYRGCLKSVAIQIYNFTTITTISLLQARNRTSAWFVRRRSANRRISLRTCVNTPVTSRFRAVCATNRSRERWIWDGIGNRNIRPFRNRSSIPCTVPANWPPRTTTTTTSKKRVQRSDNTVRPSAIFFFYIWQPVSVLPYLTNPSWKLVFKCTIVKVFDVV